MGRPKANKETTVAQTPPEFDYDSSEELYSKVMSAGATQAPEPTISNTVNVDPVVTTAPPAPQPNLTFLVEGKVRLDQEGANPIFADQRRIVNARNVDEAIQKFMNYFSNMSNHTQRYMVIQVAASETIL